MKSRRTGKLRRLTVGVLLVLMAAVVAGCGSSELKNYLIKVEGTEGAAFEGVYMYKIDDAPNTDKISGTVPAEFPVEADEISLQATKTSPDGTIKITVTANGEVVGEEEISQQGQKIQIMHH